MKKNGKELTQEEMEKATGGDLSDFSFDEPVISLITQTAHCRSCKKEMASFGGKYRCQTGSCKECGKDKTPAEVDWY